MRRGLKSTLTYFLVLLFSTFSFPSKISFFLKVFTFLKSFIFLPLPQFSRLTPTMPSVAPAPTLPSARIRNFNQLHVLLHFSFHFLLHSSLELTSPLKPLPLYHSFTILNPFCFKPPSRLITISFHFLTLF